MLAIDDFTQQLRTRGSGTDGGGLVVEVKDYLWIQRQQLGAAGEGRGGRLRQWRRERSNAKMMCGVSSIVLC